MMKVTATHECLYVEADELMSAAGSVLVAGMDSSSRVLFRSEEQARHYARDAATVLVPVRVRVIIEPLDLEGEFGKQGRGPDAADAEL